MSLADRERLLRLKTLRAERAAAALAKARIETERRARDARTARIAEETRMGIEVRIRDRTYREVIGRPTNAAGLDAMDGTMIALSDATAAARVAAKQAAASLAKTQEAEEAIRAEAKRSDRAREVWERLTDDARREADRAARLREEHATEAAVEIGTLDRRGWSP